MTGDDCSQPNSPAGYITLPGAVGSTGVDGIDAAPVAGQPGPLSVCACGGGVIAGPQVRPWARAGVIGSVTAVRRQL